MIAVGVLQGLAALFLVQVLEGRAHEHAVAVDREDRAQVAQQPQGPRKASRARVNTTRFDAI